MRFIKLLIFVLFFTNLSNVNAQLLSNLQTDDKNTAEEILKVLLPIATYDPSIVIPTVNEKGIKIFKGIDDDLKTEYSDTLDDKKIYKHLNAKDSETLLYIPVAVTIQPTHLDKFKKTLEELASSSHVIDGSDQDQGKYSITGKNTVHFYSGAVKGMPRTQIVNETPNSPIIENYYALGFKSISARLPSLGGEGAWVHKPFQYYGFTKQHNNGKLCARLVEKIGNEIKDPDIYDEYTKGLKAGAENSWSNRVAPAVILKFYDSKDNILLSDTIIRLGMGRSSMRHASATGWGTAVIGQGDTYQSIITADTVNGWHPTDRYIKGVHVLDSSSRFSFITRPIAYSIQTSRSCTFGIAENTNFAIVTKVTQDIMKKTAKITVEYDHVKGWMRSPQCWKEDWEKNVNCNGRKK
jgi:hypothetical protein